MVVLVVVRVRVMTVEVLVVVRGCWWWRCYWWLGGVGGDGRGVIGS